MPNYQNGKIYKLICNTTNKVYIGSTTTTLKQRLRKHHTPSNNTMSKQIIEGCNYEIILLENYPCNSKLELLKREGYFIDNNECINKVKPGRTKKDYNKSYYEKNKEKYKEWNKKNYEKRKCLIGT